MAELKGGGSRAQPVFIGPKIGINVETKKCFFDNPLPHLSRFFTSFIGKFQGNCLGKYGSSGALAVSEAQCITHISKYLLIMQSYRKRGAGGHTLQE